MFFVRLLRMGCHPGVNWGSFALERKMCSIEVRMKLTARSRYAVRIVLELAQSPRDTPVSIAAIAERSGIALRSVELILHDLRTNGIVGSVLGASGGYLLERSPESISLGDLVRIMENGVQLSVCSGEKANECPRQEQCPSRKVWRGISSAIEQHLETITIASLAVGTSCAPAVKAVLEKRR